MQRTDFGLWGLELSQEDFAKALAALGVFESGIESWPSVPEVETIRRVLSQAATESKGLFSWAMGLMSPGDLDKLKPPVSARLFVDAWDKFRDSYTGDLRFELHLSQTGDYFWVAEQLLGPAVKSASLYVRADEPQTGVGWDWPLRIGFLKGEEHQRLRQELERALRTSGLKRLVDFVNLEKAGDDCDLLLLPQELRGALADVLKEAWRRGLRAGPGREQRVV